MRKCATDERPSRRRANGEGTIYQDAAGHWRGALAWVAPDGTRRRRTVYGPSQAEARRKLTKLRRDVDQGIEPAVGSLTVDAFLRAWIERERGRVRPSTWRGYEQRVRTSILPALGRVQIARLTPADVEAMTSRMIAEGRSPRTAVAVRVTLRRALGDAVRDGLVHRNVAALARPPRVPVEAMVPGRDYYEPAQTRVLLESVGDHPTGPLVTLAATTGLRQGEVLGLTWAAIDLDAGMLSVRGAMARTVAPARADRQSAAPAYGYALAEPKTARSRRTIHLPARAVAALRVQADRQRAAREAAGAAWQDTRGMVFTDADLARRPSDGPPAGLPLRGYTVTAAFHAMTDAAGLPRIPFHGLRHSAATALLAGGVPLRVVADMLGHSTIVVTANLYAAVVPELRRDAADAMDRMLS